MERLRETRYLLPCTTSGGSFSNVRKASPCREQMGIVWRDRGQEERSSGSKRWGTSAAKYGTAFERLRRGEGGEDEVTKGLGRPREDRRLWLSPERRGLSQRVRGAGEAGGWSRAGRPLASPALVARERPAVRVSRSPRSTCPTPIAAQSAGYPGDPRS